MSGSVAHEEDFGDDDGDAGVSEMQNSAGFESWLSEALDALPCKSTYPEVLAAGSQRR